MTEQTVSASSPDAERRRVIAAVLLIVFCSGTAFGMALPLIALDLERRGYDPVVIGAMAAFSSVAALVVGPFMQVVLRRIGAVKAILGGFTAYAASMVAFPLVEGLAVLAVLRFIHGVGFTIGWVFSEALLNHTARDDDRGRLIGWYSAVFMGGMALGPVVLTMAGSEGVLPFAIGAAIVLVCLAIVLPMRSAYGGLDDTAASHRAGGMLALLWLAPVGFVAAALSGAAESIFFTLLPLYGLGVGLTETAAITLATAFAIGAIVFQVPLGWLADRVDRLALLAGVVAVGLVSTLAMAAGAPDPWLLLPAAVVCGAAVGGLYTVGLVVIGARFASGSLIVANALFVMSYTTATIGGPLAAGAAMTAWPPHGFVALAAGLFGLALVGLYAGRRLGWLGADVAAGKGKG
ncbi:MAG: MFS transporter [Rhodospirillaceae bacterium]|nr:MFS transporter [Rhodospirillaceae bacterium]